MTKVLPDCSGLQISMNRSHDSSVKVIPAILIERVKESERERVKVLFCDSNLPNKKNYKKNQFVKKK